MAVSPPRTSVRSFLCRGVSACLSPPVLFNGQH